MKVIIEFDSSVQLNSKDEAILRTFLGEKIESKNVQTTQTFVPKRETIQEQPKDVETPKETVPTAVKNVGEEALTVRAKANMPSASGADLLKEERKILRVLVAELSEDVDKKIKLRDFMTENCGNPDRFANMDFKYNYDLYNYACTLA